MNPLDAPVTSAHRAGATLNTIVQAKTPTCDAQGACPQRSPSNAFSMTKHFHFDTEVDAMVYCDCFVTQGWADPFYQTRSLKLINKRRRTNHVS